MSRDTNEKLRDADDPEPMRAKHFDLAIGEPSKHKDSESLLAAARACLVDDEGQKKLTVVAAAEKYGVDRATLTRRIEVIRNTLAEIFEREGWELASVALTREERLLLESIEAKRLEPVKEKQAKEKQRRAARAVTDTRRREKRRAEQDK